MVALSISVRREDLGHVASNQSRRRLRFIPHRRDLHHCELRCGGCGCCLASRRCTPSLDMATPRHRRAARRYRPGLAGVGQQWPVLLAGAGGRTIQHLLILVPKRWPLVMWRRVRN